MDRKSYAIAFLVILIVFCLGAYAGISLFLVGGQRLTTLWSERLAPAHTATSAPPPTSAPAATAAPSATFTAAPVVVTPTPPAIVTPAPAVITPAAPTATPLGAGLVGATPTFPWVTNLPTAMTPPGGTPGDIWATPTAPAGRYLFTAVGGVRHDDTQGCYANYIRGTVRDAQGTPLEGVRVRAYDQWGNEAVAFSKGGTDLGQYDVVIGSTPNLWYVVVLDSAGNPISPVVEVPHRQEGPHQKACWHWVDWRRTR
ncbi:MAG: hypothetical protein GX605_01070 [Chloroflexi bacterium]|nr:hypothetical protein [Chloroflexota bacterium]